MHDLKKEELRRLDGILAQMKSGKSAQNSGKYRMALTIQHVSYINMPLSEKDGYVFDYDTCTWEIVGGRYYSKALGGQYMEVDLDQNEVSKILKVYHVDPKFICRSIISAGLPNRSVVRERKKSLSL